ncbi:MAG: ParA family protein, partial [Rubrivivax sp.]
MPIVVVANPKGGVGKSTLSTNVAGYFARQG